ncbi:MAG: AraC family transcriptional regulator [Armatimonadia bacterium]
MRTDEARPAELPLPPAGLAGQLSFSFYWAREYDPEPGWTFIPPKRRPYATLWLIRDGELVVDTGSETGTCGPGTLVAWPPGAVREAENRLDHPALLYTISFNLQVWGELDFFRLYRVPPFHRVADFEAFDEPCAALVKELTTYDAVTLVAEGWARVLVGRWLGELEQTRALQPAAGVDERLSEVLAAIEGDLAGDWSLQRLAEMMRLSKVRMRELFVRAVGLPPLRYITLRRIDHARGLLRDTDLTSAEVARRCGYEDPGYFSRMFHRIAGMQPSVYREQARFRRD